MKIVQVTYTVKAAYAEQNKENIQQVMADLREINNPGINYHVCLNADGVTFTHTAFIESDAANKVLMDLASFQSFQQQLKASGPEAGPKQEHQTLVGSSKALF